MNDLAVARRYAKALYQEAQAHGSAAEVDEDVQLIHESLEGSRELVQVFESPTISREKKTAIVKSLFDGKVRPITLRFLDLLIEKEREDVFPGIVEAYGNLRDEENGIVEAQVRTAMPLGEAERQEVVARLEKMTGKTVRPVITVDPALIGGVVIRIGDVVYDGSVRNQLDTLRERLEHGAPIAA